MASSALILSSNYFNQISLLTIEVIRLMRDGADWLNYLEVLECAA